MERTCSLATRESFTEGGGTVFTGDMGSWNRGETGRGMRGRRAGIKPGRKSLHFSVWMGFPQVHLGALDAGACVARLVSFFGTFVLRGLGTSFPLLLRLRRRREDFGGGVVTVALFFEGLVRETPELEGRSSS
mmetsp:Transcript_7024/g.16634  ORF Transcript_7024/g.16634 Transcript_7024/m.16634 type:complete len:133 (+) Transcript_7024:263-661(+)